MKSILALLAAIAIGDGIYQDMSQIDPLKKTEGKKETVRPAQQENDVPRGDPLPPGSMLRFGTSRFRHGIPVSTLAVSADGKMAVAVNGNHILGATRVFDLISGRVLYTLGGWEGTAIEAAAISPDGRTIVTKQDCSLRLRNAATGQELRKIDLPRPTSSYSRNEWVAFTPNGQAIAVTSQGKVLHLIDSASGQTIRDFPHDNPESSLGDHFATVLGIAFSSDGKLMATGGFANDRGHYFAWLWDVETGRELRRFMHGKTSYGIPSLAFSPDGKTLATRSHDGRLRLFDVDTGKERKTFPKDGGGRRQGTVAFSPDGKTVAAAGDSIRLYDLATEAERLRIARKQATGLQFTDGGKTLTGAVTGAIYRWDMATGKTLTPEAGDSIVEQIIVTADGRRVITHGQNGDVHIWDAAKGHHLRAITASWQRGLALSPDGRFLVWPEADPSVKFTDPHSPNTIHEGSRLCLYDIAAGQRVGRFPGFPGDAHGLTFTHDGRSLVTVDHRDGMVRLWHVETRKVDRQFQAVPEAERKQSHHVWRTALSPDGKTMAVAYDDFRGGGGLGFRNAPHLVRLWDVASGRETHTLYGHGHYVLSLAFSPDGQLLITAGEGRSQVFVWDAITGKRVAAVPDGLPIGASAVAFSPDGRFLATALPEGAIRLWEVATWTARNEYQGHRDRPTALTFAPGGRLLSGSLDTTVLAWDIRPPRVAGTGSLETAWIDLAEHESSDAFQSMGRFLAVPSEAVKFFADQIKSVAAPDVKHIQKLLAALDSDEFSERESASKTLADLGQQAKPFVEEVAKTTRSAEVRTRTGKILEGLQKKTPEEIRQLRMVLTLELIDEDGSRNLLKKWTVGRHGALLAEEAAAALKRLESAAKAKR